MKRSKDQDDDVRSTVKRSVIPSCENPSSSSKKLITANHAQAYLKDVRGLLQDKMEKYYEFEALMKDFRAKRIDVLRVIAGVKELFWGHPILIQGFNTFVPKGYEITLPLVDEPPKKKPLKGSGQTLVSSKSQKKPKLALVDTSIAYLKDVRDTLKDNEEKNKEFTDLMNDYEGKRIGTTEVVARVNELFSEHPHLIIGFKIFLPKRYGVVSLPEDESPKKPFYYESLNFVNEVKARFQNDEHVFRSFIDIIISYGMKRISTHEVYQQVSSLFQGHNDLMEEFRNFFSDD